MTDIQTHQNKQSTDSKSIIAFTGIQRFCHKHTIHFILLLAVTGLPVLSHAFSCIAYLFAVPYDFVSHQDNVILADGIMVVRMLHRVLAFLFILMLIPFLIAMLVKIRSWQIWPEQGWKPQYIVEGIRQLFIAYIRFESPNTGKYNMGQKLMAWTIMLTTGVMVISGFILMFRDIFSPELQVYARAGHAIGFVLLMIMLVAHCYFALFPTNRKGLTAMFGDGKLSKLYVRQHHKLWYKKL
ncbi:Formate dehydrogenase, cytochrome b556(fdo) subunit [invertebrate metagenome]|uniref:Formate dehydrogenase, cytochrome b556(Fdo) subunit n=1 Tax=invertebrate metagenome TaxID=1711999 RepID=A0A2H9T6D7_9ZZZZ